MSSHALEDFCRKQKSCYHAMTNRSMVFLLGKIPRTHIHKDRIGMETMKKCAYVCYLLTLPNTDGTETVI